MSLRFVINGEPDMVVCGEAEDAQPALAMVEHLCPDIVVADIALKRSHGLDLIRDLHIRYPSLRMFVHSYPADEPHTTPAANISPRKTRVALSAAYLTGLRARQFVLTALASNA